MGKYTFVWKKNSEITSEDKDAIHDLVMKYYPDGRSAYKQNVWYSSIEPDAMLFLYDEGQLISYSKFVIQKVLVAEKEANIAGFSLLTHGEYQGKGIAGLMVDELIHSFIHKGADILYATTEQEQVAHILKKRGFLQFGGIVTHKETKESIDGHGQEMVFVYSSDAHKLETLMQAKEMYLPRGMM